jgi:hypothetical protein
MVSKTSQTSPDMPLFGFSAACHSINLHKVRGLLESC